MSPSVLLTLALASLGVLYAKCEHINDRPIVGILSQESVESLKKFGPTYIPASYVKFIESAGARVVPILVNQTDSYYKQMFQSLNGMLWPGGEVDSLFKSGYGRAGKIFYELAKQSYEKGDYFPIWGTCQGLQLMSVLTAGKNILATMGAVRENLNVTLEVGYNKSRILGNAPDEILTALKTKAVTYNFHDYSVTPTNFSNSEGLKDNFNIVATSQTDNGKEFIAMMEGKKYPFYAVQFHPEKPIFEWSLDTNLKHDEVSIKTSQYLANFFVSEARKSLHTFQSPEAESAALIYNYNETYTKGVFHINQCFFFNP
ncbi:gamma-glutamyl hydrolase-like isoform X2 [Apostichopus japonicus]|uniref:gamma-glutamyl hydrolase-like isoform X2 n=1 Tax=Stichopus japonicus TaxID=307972 RepID=UPI003AB697BC